MQRGKQARRDAKALFRPCVVNGSLEEDRLRQVVKRVAESKNRNNVAVLEALWRLVQLDQLRRTALVESATALSSELQSEIRGKLTQIYGTGLNISFRENASLIGGLRIQVGSTVIDSSVKSRLEDLAARF
jgi:F-type H+-transporting ATPase subunit delta